jgi:D-tyrosyl-tRNA(Tyr) deacylase
LGERASGPLRALVQRVSQAAVDVEGDRVAQIGPGMLVLLGVGAGDGEAEADRLAAKVAALRIFDDAEGKMNEPLGEREILCVSQFTLYGDARKATGPATWRRLGPRTPSRSMTASASGWAPSRVSSAPAWALPWSTTAR